MLILCICYIAMAFRFSKWIASLRLVALSSFCLGFLSSFFDLRFAFVIFVIQSTVNKFLKYYESFETRPTFETVEEMLKWAGLHSLTTQTLHEELVNLGLSPLLIQELVTVIILPYFLYIHHYQYSFDFFFHAVNSSRTSPHKLYSVQIYISQICV